jgi:hypothetical protein
MAEKTEKTEKKAAAPKSTPKGGGSKADRK